MFPAPPTLGHEGTGIWVVDQYVVDDYVVLDTNSDADGWIVIYSNDNGELGEILGYSPIERFWTLYRPIKISVENRTDRLLAVMHNDTGVIGKFEPNIDSIIIFEDNRYFEEFQILVTLDPKLTVQDQRIVEGKITIKSVVSAGSGWIVAYKDNNGEPGEIIGKQPVFHGINNDTKVRIQDMSNSGKIHILVHSDTGVVGEFEYPELDPLMIWNDGSISSIIEISDNGVIGFHYALIFACILCLSIYRRSKRY